jgi:hypothetical protein
MRSVLFAVVFVLWSSALTFAEEKSPADHAFERLKRLAGTWDATEQGNPKFAETVTYTLTGRGSVIIEDMKVPDNPMGHMLTAYHLDRGRLVLTHYCGAGNQPRMRFTSATDGGNHLVFEMYDITNLATPEAYHSQRVEVIFRNDDRVDLVYAGAAGAKQYTQVFQLTRRTTASPEKIAESASSVPSTGRQPSLQITQTPSS